MFSLVLLLVVVSAEESLGTIKAMFGSEEFRSDKKNVGCVWSAKSFCRTVDVGASANDSLNGRKFSTSVFQLGNAGRRREVG